MECVNTRPYEGNPKIVRLRIYRCRCGAEEATTEARHSLAVIKRAIHRQHKRREKELATKRGAACRS
jgi:hypothetical protein